MANPTDRPEGKVRPGAMAALHAGSMTGAESVVGSLASLPPLPPAAVTGTAPPGMFSAITETPGPLDPLTEFFLDAGRDGGVNETEMAVSETPDVHGDRERILVFGLGGEEYGLEIMAVREILKAPVLTPIPRAPPMVLGVFSLRGLVIPVLSLTDLLGVIGDAAGGGRDARVLVVGQGDETVGLWVHRVASVVWMPRKSVEAAPAGLSTTRRALLRGLGRLEQRLIILLDAAQLATQLGISLPSAASAEVS